MAVRATMADLIGTTRQLVGDVASASQDFTDQDIQDVLDAHREDVRYEVLTPRPTLSTAGILYNDYYSEVGYWEAGETLVWGNFAPLTALTSDRVVGHWTFANQYPPVLLAGQTYDIYAAAAELLERRIALRSFTMFDFVADGRTMRLGTVLDRWQKLRDTYIAKSRGHVISLYREDLAGGDGSGGTAGSDALARAGSGGQDHPAAGPVSRYVPYITGE